MGNLSASKMLNQHKHAVEEHGGVAEVERKNLGHAVRNQDDGGNAKAGRGVQGQPQGQNQKAQSIKEKCDTKPVFSKIGSSFSLG